MVQTADGGPVIYGGYFFGPKWALLKHHSLPQCFWIAVAGCGLWLGCRVQCWVHVDPFLITVYISFDSFFQQNHIMPCKEAQIISNWSLEHDYEFTVLHSAQSPDPSPKGQHWDLIKWDPNITDFSTTLLNLCHGQLRQFKPSTSMVHLTKWQNSVTVQLWCKWNGLTTKSNWIFVL